MTVVVSFFAAVLGSLHTVLLVDNGSRRPASTLALRKTAAALSDRLSGREVRPASLAFSDAVPATMLNGMPASTLQAELAALLADGATGAIIAPLFLGPSDGLRRGIDEARTALSTPSFDLRAGTCLVDELDPTDKRIARALAAQVLRIARQERLATPLKVLVIDHGTPSARVNAVRERLAREGRGLLGHRASDVAGASMERRDGAAYNFNEPLLERALSEPPFDRGDVILAMAFVLPGRHAGEGGDVAQIAQRAMDEAAARPAPDCERVSPPLRVHTTPLLAAQPLVLDVLAERVWCADQFQEDGEGGGP